MASGARPFFRGKSFSKSKDQRVDIDIPLPRDDRPSWGRRPSNPSSLKASVATTAAADLVTQSRGDTSETAVHAPFAEEVRRDLAKLADMDVFHSVTNDTVTNDILSSTAGRVQDGNDSSLVYTTPHADDKASASPSEPTSNNLHRKAEVSHVSIFNLDDSIADAQHAPKDIDPMSHQPCRQGGASPRPGSSVGGAQSRRASLPLPARPATSASPRRKSFTVSDADSAANQRPKRIVSPKKFSTMNDVALDMMGASTGVPGAMRSDADDGSVQRTPALGGGGRPSSRSASSRPGFKKASTFSEITSAGEDPSSPKGEGGGRARRLSLIPAGQLQRQLSFADESLDELSANIFTEEPELDWLEDFWNRVLVGTPPAECRGLSTRSIDYWVEIFNRWQAMGSWKPGSAPKFMDAYELQELLSVPMQKTLAWVKLFDPAAYAQHASTRSAMDLKRVKISVPAFLASGIFLSTTISKRQKIRFLLGLFDEEDSRILNSSQFVEMISSFLHGIACAFALVDTVNLAPKPSVRRKLGKCLFDRVVDRACCRLPFWEAKKIKATDSAPIWLIEEWFLSEGGELLAAPFALLLERFSVRELEDDPESLEDEDKSFKLSHTAPVELPLQTAAALDTSFLRRDEIGLVRKVFRECERQCDFSLSHEDIGRALGVFIPPDLWCDRLVRGLDEMERLRGLGQKPILSLFFRKLCPTVKPRHLRLFQIWMKELDHIEELKVHLATSRRMQEYFESYVARPVLPARVRQELLEEYEGLAYNTLQASVTRDAFRKRFYDGGSRVTKEDYVAAMCPTEFRHKEGNPAVNLVVGQLLRLQVAKLEEALARKEALFAKNGEAVTARRKFIKPSVPDHQWDLWNEAFDSFSSVESDSREGHVSLLALVRQNDVCPAVCDFMCQIVTGSRAEGPDPGFSKESFLQKLLELSPWRVKKEILSQGRLSAV